ncbi:MAG: hypothetical protein KAS04_00410 [Candidatus Aenigmarchaeota archaeon]|nr:hypothetical protein [Candidatus Aenigmarchaeota archaeon]
MKEVIFEGEKHKITADGKDTFFLYVKVISDGWELKDKNIFGIDMYQEALNSLKDMLMMEMSEEELITKLSENGFFKKF